MYLVRTVGILSTFKLEVTQWIHTESNFRERWLAGDAVYGLWQNARTTINLNTVA